MVDCDENGRLRLGGWALTVKLFVSQSRQKDGRAPLHWAARNGHLEMCRWLVARGADANAPTNDGTRPLHWAVWRGQLAVCHWLIEEAGADLHVINSFGCNAIQWAAQSDATDDLVMCRWLLRRALSPVASHALLLLVLLLRVLAL